MKKIIEIVKQKYRNLKNLKSSDDEEEKDLDENLGSFMNLMLTLAFGLLSVILVALPFAAAFLTSWLVVGKVLPDNIIAYLAHFVVWITSTIFSIVILVDVIESIHAKKAYASDEKARLKINDISNDSTMSNADRRSQESLKIEIKIKGWTLNGYTTFAIGIALTIVVMLLPFAITYYLYNLTPSDVPIVSFFVDDEAVVDTEDEEESRTVSKLVWERFWYVIDFIFAIFFLHFFALTRITRKIPVASVGVITFIGKRFMTELFALSEGRHMLPPLFGHIVVDIAEHEISDEAEVLVGMSDLDKKNDGEKDNSSNVLRARVKVRAQYNYRVENPWKLLGTAEPTTFTDNEGRNRHGYTIESLIVSSMKEILKATLLNLASKQDIFSFMGKVSEHAVDLFNLEEAYFRQEVRRQRQRWGIYIQSVYISEIMFADHRTLDDLEYNLREYFQQSGQKKESETFELLFKSMENVNLSEKDKSHIILTIMNKLDNTRFIFEDSGDGKTSDIVKGLSVHQKLNKHE